jgi:hypothetical protein
VLLTFTVLQQITTELSDAATGKETAATVEEQANNSS